MINDERVDLSPLDPRGDQLRWERLIRSVMDAAAPELARRTSSATPLAVLGSWARPALTAAALVAALAVGALAMTERVAEAADAPGTVADALGVPEPASVWLAEQRGPTAGDVAFAMEQRR